MLRDLDDLYLVGSISGRPSLVSMNGMNTASKLKRPHSIAVVWALTQSLKIELAAT
jgi:hypothetical protein